MAVLYNVVILDGAFAPQVESGANTDKFPKLRPGNIYF
mgnify:CR=1 FL=1